MAIEKNSLLQALRLVAPTILLRHTFRDSSIFLE